MVTQECQEAKIDEHQVWNVTLTNQNHLENWQSKKSCWRNPGNITSSPSRNLVLCSHSYMLLKSLDLWENIFDKKCGTFPGNSLRVLNLKKGGLIIVTYKISSVTTPWGWTCNITWIPSIWLFSKSLFHRNTAELTELTSIRDDIP